MSTIREARLRRALSRAGYTMTKSRARDPLDVTFGGYQIMQGQRLVAGQVKEHDRGYGLSLDGVEAWLVDLPRVIALQKRVRELEAEHAGLVANRAVRG